MKELLQNKKNKSINQKITKKINNFIKHLFQIQNYIFSNIDKFNKHNSQLINNTSICLSYYNGTLFPVQDKKMMTFYKKSLITNVTSHIHNFDYNDLEMLQFVEYVINL